MLRHTQGGRLKTWSGFPVWKSVAQALLARMENPIEGVMASPPTITVGAAGANSTVLTNRTTAIPSLIPNNAVFTTISGAIGVAAGNYRGEYVMFDTGSLLVGTQGFGQRFRTNAPMVDVCLRDLSGSGFNVRVTDASNPLGKWVSASNITLPTSTGSNFYYVSLDFGSPGDRLLEFFYGSGTQFRGYNVGNGGATTIYVATVDAEANPFLMTTYGDSYTAGTGPVGVRDGYSYKLANELGVRSPVASGRGSTGYIANASGAAYTFRQRLADMTRVNTPQFVLVMGGINDNGQNLAALEAEVTAFWIQVRNSFPNALLVGLGPQHAPLNDPSTAYNDAVRNGFAAANNSPRMRFFENSAYWDPGDPAKYTDGVHWNDAGTDAFVAAFMPDLTAWLTEIAA